MGKNLFEIVKGGKPKVNSYQYEQTGSTFDFRTLTMKESDRIGEALAEKKSTLDKLQVTLDFGIVTGWKNLTIKALEEIAKMDVSNYSPEEMNEEFPFVQEEAPQVLLQIADRNPQFGLFLLNSVTDAYQKEAKKLDEQKKI